MFKYSTNNYAVVLVLGVASLKTGTECIRKASCFIFEYMRWKESKSM